MRANVGRRGGRGWGWGGASYPCSLHAVQLTPDGGRFGSSGSFSFFTRRFLPASSEVGAAATTMAVDVAFETATPSPLSWALSNASASSLSARDVFRSATPMRSMVRATGERSTAEARFRERSTGVATTSLDILGERILMRSDCNPLKPSTRGTRGPWRSSRQRCSANLASSTLGRGDSESPHRFTALSPRPCSCSIVQLSGATLCRHGRCSPF